jgi:hypothetical protein
VFGMRLVAYFVASYRSGVIALRDGFNDNGNGDGVE